MSLQGKGHRCASEYRVSGFVYGAPGLQALVGASGHEPGRLHDLSGQQHRQRRDPDHPAQPAPVGVRAGVGGQQLPAHAGRAAPGRGQAGGRVRAAPAVPDRPGRLHAVLAGRRAGRQRRRPHRQPGHPGRRRGAADADHAGHHRGHLRRYAGTQHGHRHLGRGRRPGPGHRPGARRPDQPALPLGLDLPDQRAGRRDHLRSSRCGTCANPGPPPRSAGSTCPA